MIKLDRPRDSDVHTLCDFVELLCLTSLDRIATRDSIKDHIHDSSDHEASDNDLDDCFRQISWRIGAYEQDYPFALDLHGRSISAPEDLSARQTLYAFLLICANLPFLDRPYTPITDAFERLAVLALKNAWPGNGVVKAFGKNETDYTGSKANRINSLAKDIGGVGLCTAESFRAGDSGDGGIDLAAWHGLLDEHERRNIYSALAQCACSRNDWSKKQSEISNDRLSANVIAPTHRWMQLMFIPQSFRDNLGRWAVPGDVGQTVLFDRLRIIRQLPREIDWAEINPPPILNTVLTERADLV
jgi:hypothetical protein